MKEIVENDVHRKVEEGRERVRICDNKGALDAFLQALSLDSSLSEVWKMLGERLADNGEGEAALVAFRKCLSLELEEAASRHGLTTVLPEFQHPGFGFVGPIDLQTLRSLEPRLAEEWIEKGIQSTRAGDNAGALDAFMQALNLDPRLPAVWKMLGERLADNGESEAALVAFRKCLSLELEEAASRHGLTTVLPELQRPGSGLVGPVDMGTLRSLEPRLSGDWIENGIQLTRVGDNAGALAAFRQALCMDPSVAEVWKMMGQRLADAGSGRQALAAFYKCLSLEMDAIADRHGLRDLLPAFFGGGSGYLGEIDPVTLRHPVPSIFIASMPKSGTVFVSDALCRGLRKPNLGMNTGGVFPNIQIPQGAIEQLRESGAVYSIHCDANRYNRIELSAKLDRMTVHLRDPRQGLVSWAHFVPRLVGYQDQTLLRQYGIPEDLFGRPLAEQFDWHIENYMPLQVDWIAGWLDAAADPEFRTKILFLTQEELVADSADYFDRLLRFNGIDPAIFTYPQPPEPGKNNVRRGETDEWRRVMSPAQCERVTAMMPGVVFERFGWNV